MAFKKGHKFAKGGARAGSGRKPDEFKQWCADLLENKKTRKFIEDLVTGQPIEEKVLDGPDGEPQKILVSAPAAARQKAIEFVASYALGKPPQALEVTTKKSPEEMAADDKRFERLYGYLGAITK